MPLSASECIRAPLSASDCLPHQVLSIREELIGNDDFAFAVKALQRFVAPPILMIVTDGLPHCMQQLKALQRFVAPPILMIVTDGLPHCMQQLKALQKFVARVSRPLSATD